jgi:hypothetical protein
MTVRVKKVPPVIPEDTCPYIDMVLSLIDNITEQDDISWRRHQKNLAYELLEHIRMSNQKLRDGGRYWYTRGKKING